MPSEKSDEYKYWQQRHHGSEHLAEPRGPPQIVFNATDDSDRKIDNKQSREHAQESTRSVLWRIEARICLREEAPASTKSNLSSLRVQGSRATPFLGKTGTFHVNHPGRLLVNSTRNTLEFTVPMARLELNMCPWLLFSFSWTPQGLSLSLATSPPLRFYLPLRWYTIAEKTR